MTQFSKPAHPGPPEMRAGGHQPPAPFRAVAAETSRPRRLLGAVGRALESGATAASGMRIGSVYFPPIREDVRDECQHDAAWPLEDE